MTLAPAADSFTIEMGPWSPTMATASMIATGASVMTCHCSSVKSLRSVIGSPRGGSGLGARRGRPDDRRPQAASGWHDARPWAPPS